MICYFMDRAIINQNISEEQEQHRPKSSSNCVSSIQIISNIKILTLDLKYCIVNSLGKYALYKSLI